jgi:hypothetical protein
MTLSLFGTVFVRDTPLDQIRVAPIKNSEGFCSVSIGTLHLAFDLSGEGLTQLTRLHQALGDYLASVP